MNDCHDCIRAGVPCGVHTKFQRDAAPSPALTSTDQLEAEQRGLPIPYASPALTREALAELNLADRLQTLAHLLEGEAPLLAPYRTEALTIIRALRREVAALSKDTEERA